VDSNSKSPTFNDVADFVRAWGRIPVKRQIDPETQFERDLGITGDDGSELLKAAQKSNLPEIPFFGNCTQAICGLSKNNTIALDLG
jgi:hypothetical protein